MLISSGTHYTSDPDPVLISPHERTSDNGHAVHTEYSTVLSFGAPTRAWLTLRISITLQLTVVLHHKYINIKLNVRLMVCCHLHPIYPLFRLSSTMPKCLHLCLTKLKVNFKTHAILHFRRDDEWPALRELHGRHQRPRRPQLHDRLRQMLLLRRQAEVSCRELIRAKCWAKVAWIHPATRDPYFWTLHSTENENWILINLQVWKAEFVQDSLHQQSLWKLVGEESLLKLIKTLCTEPAKEASPRFRQFSWQCLGSA